MMQDIGSIFRHNESISFTRCHDGDVFFLQQNPAENNAQVLMRLTNEGQLQRFTAPGISVRSRLHEYGAVPYCVGKDAVYFCRHDTQQICRQAFDTNGPLGSPTALTPDSGQASLRYGELLLDSHRNQLIAVREDHRPHAGEELQRPDKEPQRPDKELQRPSKKLQRLGKEPQRASKEPHNCLVSIDLSSGGEGSILFAQSDFVTNPKLSPDGQFLAFVSWDHPNMPWDETHLWLATLDEQPQLATLHKLQQPAPGAIQQIQFSADGDLYFLADWTNWWNLYRLDAELLGQGPEAFLAPETPLCERSHDCAGPPWVPGLQHYAVLNRDTVALAVLRDAHWDVELIDLNSGRTHHLWSRLGAIDALCAQGDDLILGYHPINRPPVIEHLSQGDARSESTGKHGTHCHGKHCPEQTHVLLQCRSDAWQSEQPVYLPRHLSFDSNANEQAHGLLYLPPDTTSPPPLLVMVHGGPTGTARSSFNPLTQFWVRQGFAVFDVNHRGSSGYGRRYRQLLLKQWGVIDIEDIVTGVRHLITQGTVDASRVVIRGGSAGGYAVLAALAQSDLFRAGTCCYGISDLLSLAAETHKFESRYVERLIGPLPETEAIYRARSPIHQLDQIQAPVLWLHGALDKVVPPNQATAIMDTLQARAPDSRYVCFDDEGHGFRLAENQIRALEEEFSFYQRVGVLAQ